MSHGLLWFALLVGFVMITALGWLARLAAPVQLLG